MPWHIWLKFGYLNHKTIPRAIVSIPSGVVWVKFQLYDVLSKNFTWLYTKPRLGSVPSPSSHWCSGHSFGGRGLSYGTPRICSGCTVHCLRGGRDSTRVASVIRPARPEASLNLDEVFEDTKIWTAVLMICLIMFFRYTHRKDDWVKKSSKSTKKRKSWKFRQI